VDAELPHSGAGYTAYSYAQTIWLLPQSIVTVSLVTALLPRLSRAAAEGRIQDLRADLTRALRLTGVVIVPAGFLFLALGPWIAELLFAHGAADAASVRPMGHMLQAFGLGLIPFSVQYVLLRAFYAFEDTRTPFLMAAWTAAVNIALATGCHLLLPARWAVTGMAAAYTLSYVAGLALTVWRLRRRLGGPIGEGRALGAGYAKFFLAAAPAAALGVAAARACADVLPGAVGTGIRTTALAAAAGTVVLAVVYLVLARLLKTEEVRALPGLR
ncbi:lipid II flippase MurJ, partial [Streptomyces sp. NPDC087850]